MKLKNTPLAALTCAALLGSAALSQGALSIGDIISVNLAIPGDAPAPSGAAVIGGLTDTWNQVVTPSAAWESSADGSYSGLNTSTGAASGVSLAFAGGVTAHGIDNSQGPDVFKSSFGLKPNVPSATVTLSGLGAGTIVDLYLYSGGYVTGEGATFNFGTGSFTATNSVSVETTYTLNDNYVKIAGLVADGSGNITGTWTAATSGNYSTFNGAQIAVVPEPSSALLGGLGMLALLRRRR
ncbi:MAG: hypothetical protein RLZZ245_1376 [Verrucomicrobiota bacterium]|jgi:hypothetical protein